jgi:aspartate oxidase
MWHKVGLLRTKEGLENGSLALNAFREVTVASKEPVNKLLIPMMLDTTEAVALLAMVREESGGAHCRFDFPVQCSDWEKRIVFQLLNNGCIVKLISV